MSAGLDTRPPGASAHEELIRRYFLAVDEERIDDVVACFVPDGSMHFSGLGEPVRGHDELHALFTAHVARFVEHVDRVARVISDGDRAISEIVFDATAPDGRAVQLENCNVYRFRDGLFEEVTVYLDSVTFREQVGG